MPSALLAVRAWHDGGRSAALRPLYASGSQYTRCLLARWRLGMLLEQLQQPLAASPGYFPPGQPPSWDTGALSCGMKKWAGS